MSRPVHRARTRQINDLLLNIPVTVDTPQIAPTEAPAPLQRRRLGQFRLRTVLAVSVVFALVLGWQVNRAAHQRRAVAAIRALGGHVYYRQDIGGEEENSGALDRLTRWIGDRFGRDLVDRVTWVDLEGVPITDDDLAHVAALRTLELLRIDGGEITGDGLARLASLGRLEVLTLQNHRNVADGLIHLKDLGRLRSIVLRNTDTSDEHIQALRAIESLENIDLGNTSISDDALPALAELPRLANLLLDGTQVTEEGVADLRERLPSVRIID